MKFKKFLTRVLIKTSVLVFCLSLLFVPSTVGFFQDIEVAGASIETGTLDLGLRSGQPNFVPGADSMEPGDSVARDIYIGKTAGSNPLEYKVSYEYVSGDEDLCQGLQLKMWYNHYHGPFSGGYANRDMRLKYSGSLSSLANLKNVDFIIPHPDDQFDSNPADGTEQWFFYQITLPPGTGYLLEKSCTFNIKVKAWQAGLEELESGFWDEEVIESTIGTMPRCPEGKTAVEVTPIDRVNIGDQLSENLHDIDGWSSPNLPGNYGGRDDGTFRQIIEETQCNEDGREAKFYLYAGDYKANLLRIKALDGLSNLDSFEVYVNDNLVGTYTDVQDSAELWHEFEVPLDNLSGRLEVKLKAIDGIWPGCEESGQVAVSWAEIDGFYCQPDELIIPGESAPTCQSPTSVDPLDTVNIGETGSEAGHNLLGWSTENLSGYYGGGDDGTYRQIISEQHCSDEYRIAGFTLDAGSNTANLLRLRVLDGISGKDGFDVYVNDEFLAHLPEVSSPPGENWQTYEIPLPNLSGEIKVRLVAINEFWPYCLTYGQVAVSWAQLAGYHCGGMPPSYPDIVINEVYYDVAGDRGTESQNEWIELYNNTDNPISLKNWSLVDGVGHSEVIDAEVSIPPHGFAVLSYDNTTWTTYWSLPPEAVTVQLTGSSAWLNNDGDHLFLKDPLGSVIDFVAWEGGYSSSYPAWAITANKGESISRITAGVDTDSVADWEVRSSPTPGTNPHSHIEVHLSQEGNNLLISFTNATGFNKVKYNVSYEHIFEGGTIAESVEGEADKELDEEELTLAPIYFGTCSSEGLVCTPHREVSEVVISLMYKKDEEIIGFSSFEFDWENLE